MKTIIVLIIFYIELILSKNINDLEYEENDYEYYDYDEEVCGPDYYETPDAGNCHHDKFPDKNLRDLFGAKVSMCCGFHGYSYRGASTKSA